MKITSISIYPIKSSRPVLLDHCQLTHHGLKYDRWWALYGLDGQVLTARQYPKLLDIQCRMDMTGCTVYYQEELIATLSDGNDKMEKIECVKIFSYDAYGTHINNEIDRWFSDFLKCSCRLLKVNTMQPRPVLEKHGGLQGDVVSFADQGPILITNEASLSDLNQRLNNPIDMNRFRPNIVIAGADPYAEDHWHELSIGGYRLRIIQPCERCIFTTIDPVSKLKDEKGEPLKTLSSYRKGDGGAVIFGVHAVPIDHGIIKIEDNVTINTNG